MLRDKIASGVDWKLVWVNEDPSVNFGAQTVSIDLSNYTEIMVTFRFTTASSTYQNFYAMVGGGVGVAFTLQNIPTAYQVYVSSRDFEATSVGVSFDDNIRKGITTTTAATTSNGYAIPTAIYAR